MQALPTSDDLQRLVSSLSLTEREELKLELRKEILRELVLDGCETVEDLKLFAFCILGKRLPDRAVCEDHQSPMDFLIHDYFKGGVTLVEACRDGFKTLGLAIANIAKLVLRRASILHLGAVQQQATNGDMYLGKLMEECGLDELILKRTTKATILENGATIQIAGCTINQANSPRVPNVRVDEGDLADPEALNETKGIPSTDRYGNQTSWTMVSTRKFANGNLYKELERIEESGKGIFFRWCYKEVTERCPDSRSGTKPAEIWVDMTDLTLLTPDEYRKRRQVERLQTKISGSSDLSDSHFDRFQVYDGCLECPIVATCRGDLKRASGIRPIADLIDLFPQWERSDWIAQKECRGVPTEGRVYRAFSRERNVPTDDFPVWRSKKTNQVLGYLIFGKDWGFEHPDVTLVGQVCRGACGHKHLWIHDELYVSHKTDEEIIQLCVELGWFRLNKQGQVEEWNSDSPVKYGKPRVVAADVTSPKGRKLWKQAGFWVPRKKSVISDGEREARKLIYPIHCKETHLHIHPRCKRLVKDLERLSKKKDRHGEPTEETEKGGESAPDHGGDAFRMIVVHAFMKKMEWIEALPLPGGKS